MYKYSHKQPDLTESQKHQESQQKQQSYFEKAKLLLLFALVVYSVYSIDKRPEALSLEKALLALGIIWAGAIPSLQYLGDRNRPPVPFLPLIGIFYASTFGLPMFWADKKIHYVWSLTDVTEQSLWLALLGVIGLIAAFYYSKLFLFSKTSPIRLTQSYPLNKLIVLLWILLILHIFSLYAASFINEIPSLGQLLDPIGYICYGMFYILRRQRNLPNIQTWILLYLCLPLEILPRFASGLLAQVMILGLFMTIIIFHESKRIPVVLITVFSIFVLIFTPLKSEYRSLTWIDLPQSQQLSVFQRSQIFIDIAIKKYSEPDAFTFTSTEDANEDLSKGRTAHILVFSNVIQDTPARVPYWEGQSYLPLLTSFIPRIIFPDKPTENTGNEFGRRYGYLSTNDDSTSFNLPWIVEMYVNFGSMGVLIGMPLVGVLLAFIEQKFNNQNMNSLEFVTGTTIVFRLVYQESNFSLMLGGIITLSVALYVLFKLFLIEKRKPII
jgi:hypothetical protein